MIAQPARNRYFLDSPVVSVQTIPSLKQARILALSELKRAKSRRLQLGPEGLSKLREKVKNAKAENDTPIPEDLFRTSVADVSEIPWISLKTVQEGRQLLDISSTIIEDAQLKEYIDSDGQALPFFVHFDNVPVSNNVLKTKFTRLTVVLVRVRHRQCLDIPRQYPGPSSSVCFFITALISKGHVLTV